MNCVPSFCTISASEKCPSQSSRMMRPVPSTRIAPSGKSTTGASVVPLGRHPAASFGTLASVSSASLPRYMLTVMFRVSLNPKSTWRRPTRLDVSEIKRLELCPKNVTLVAQCLDGTLLLHARSGVIEHILKIKRGVFRRLRQPCLELIEPRSEPQIVLTQRLHQQTNQVARRQ